MDFKPKQISKFKHKDHISYQTYAAPADLNADIFYIWNLHSDKKLKQFDYLIIPDTCIDIVLEEQDGAFCNPIISKPFYEATTISLSGQFNYWGIRFKPGKILKYLWFELSTITDDFQDIDLEVKTFNSIADFLEKFCKFKPSQFHGKFLRFNYDSANILTAKLSSRQKARLFESLTGFKINTYRKIQKFHVSLNDPYLHFYDQSHYIKTFKDLTNQSPKSFSRNFLI